MSRPLGAGNVRALMRGGGRLLVGIMLIAAAGCRSQPASQAEARRTEAPGREQQTAAERPIEAAPVALIEVAPHVRLDRAARLVEFDGVVPVDVHDPQTPVVFLELVCCTPDTREHESLVMTKAVPSHVHAALLAAGFQSGEPGLVDFRGEKVVGRAPSGDRLRVEFVYRDAAGREVVATPTDWIVQAETGKRFGPLPPGPGVWGESGGWVFSGSRFVKRRDPASGEQREVYDADGSGVVIGLTTFGSEMIAWGQVLSPESSITAPVWIADVKAVPKAGTPVVVRLRPE